MTPEDRALYDELFKDLRSKGSGVLDAEFEAFATFLRVKSAAAARERRQQIAERKFGMQPTAYRKSTALTGDTEGEG